jgi:hypothetical protein
MLERGELWLLFFDLLFSLNRSMTLCVFIATLAQGPRYYTLSNTQLDRSVDLSKLSPGNRLVPTRTAAISSLLEFVDIETRLSFSPDK